MPLQTQKRATSARVVARLTADYSKAGLGRPADANRAATQLARREADIQAAEAEILVASANLCRLLNLDPSIRLHPTDAVVVPQPLVPDPIPVAELIALGMLNRPELAARRAAIEATRCTILGGAKILAPFFTQFAGRRQSAGAHSAAAATSSALSSAGSPAGRTST